MNGALEHDAGPTYVTAEIPSDMATRFEAACDSIRAAQAEGDGREPEDIIAEWGMQHAEALAEAGILEKSLEAGE